MLSLYKHIDKKGKILAVITIILSFFQSFFYLGQTWCMYRALDTFQNNVTDLKKYFLFLILMLCCSVGTILFGIIVVFLGTKVSLVWTKIIRSDMFKKICTLDLMSINKFTNASLLTRFTNDVQKMQQQLMMMLTMVVSVPFTIIGGLIMSFISNYYIGIAGTTILFISLASGYLYLKKAISLVNDVQGKIDQTNLIMRENVLGSRVIKSFCLEKKQQERFNEVNVEYFQKSKKLWIMFAFMAPIINSILNIIVITVYIVGGNMIKSGADITGQQLYYLSTLLQQVFQTIINVIIVWVITVRVIPSARRINEIFNTQPKIFNSSSNVVMFDKNNMDIIIDNVSFNYTSNTSMNVLNNVSFSIKKGETIGIIGESGSGKTTLINLISRKIDPISGKITIGNVDLKQYNLEDFYKNISVVFQDPFMFFGDIEYNLKFGKHDANQDELDEATKIACAYDFIHDNEKKYHAKVDQRGRNFSGGQRQRLCIARSILEKPSILILDDSTSALDIITENKLQNNIKNKLNGTTLIIVAQRISSVINADKIIVMNKGKISGIGTHEYLKKNNLIYQNIIASQMSEENK